MRKFEYCKWISISLCRLLSQRILQLKDDKELIMNIKQILYPLFEMLGNDIKEGHFNLYNGFEIWFERRIKYNEKALRKALIAYVYKIKMEKEFVTPHRGEIEKICSQHSTKKQQYQVGQGTRHIWIHRKKENGDVEIKRFCFIVHKDHKAYQTVYAL